MPVEKHATESDYKTSSGSAKTGVVPRQPLFSDAHANSMTQDAILHPPPATNEPADPAVAALAHRLRRHPELAEVVDVWALLDEPIRQAILALIRVKGGPRSHQQESDS